MIEILYLSVKDNQFKIDKCYVTSAEYKNIAQHFLYISVVWCPSEASRYLGFGIWTL